MDNFSFKVDESKCIHCGLCEKDCITKVITLNKNKIPKAEDGKILMQGVVDCAIIEDDGVTVLDFKSDYVKSKEILRKYFPH